MSKQISFAFTASQIHMSRECNISRALWDIITCRTEAGQRKVQHHLFDMLLSPGYLPHLPSRGGEHPLSSGAGQEMCCSRQFVFQCHVTATTQNALTQDFVFEIFSQSFKVVRILSSCTRESHRFSSQRYSTKHSGSCSQQ